MLTVNYQLFADANADIGCWCGVVFTSLTTIIVCRDVVGV